MFCPNCKSQMTDGSSFCNSCGARISESSNMNRQERQLTDELGTQYVSVLSCSGVVVGAQTWTDTHVSGGGTTGGYVSSTGAVIMHSRPVSSTTIETNRFFVKQGNSEKLFELKGASFAVRDGHFVSIVCATYPTGGAGWDYYYFNHSTGHEYVDYGILNELTRYIQNRKTGCGLVGLYALFLGIPAWFVTTAFIGIESALFLIWALLFIPMIFFINKRNNKAQKQLDYLMYKFVNDARQVLSKK